MRMVKSLASEIKTSDIKVYADLKNCKDYKSITEISLSVVSSYDKVKIKYVNPDTIVLKKTFFLKKDSSNSVIENGKK